MDAHSSSSVSLRPSITPSQLIAVGLVAASIGWAVWLLRESPDREEVELLADAVLPSSELAIIEAAFDRAQLTDYRSEAGRVWVPRARQSAYKRALVDNGALPREFGGSRRRVLENNSPWQSKSVQTELLRVATQEELAQQIGSMPGIKRAAVIYDEQEQNGAGGLRGNPVKTASVSVCTQPGTELDEATAESIRKLVSAAIAGLTPDRVTVIDLSNGRAHADPLPSNPDFATIDPLLAKRVVREKFLAKKVLQAIAFVRGATVSVDVEFEPAARKKSPESFAEKSGSFQVDQRTAAANVPAEVGRDEQPSASPERTAAVHLNERIRVAIAVPEGYLRDAFGVDATGPDQSDRELERIRRHVDMLRPETADPEGWKVVVTPVATVADRRETPSPVAPEPPSMPQAAGSAQAPVVSAQPEAVAAQPQATSVEPHMPVAIDTIVAPLVDAVRRRLDGEIPVTKREWAAVMSIVVGIVAGWLWWAGSRRRVAAAPSIDWSMVRPRESLPHPRSVAEREPLDRAAA